MFAGNKEFVIALDEGTTNAKAIALDGFGNVVAKFSQPLAIQTPREGWVEQSGEALISASLDVIAQAINHVGAENVAALAISNQRETAIGWYRQSGKPLNAAITWQCTRSAEFCETLRREGKEQQIKTTTGLPIAPLFSASKMRWLLESTPEGVQLADQGEICLGTIDAWLLWNLTAGDSFCCDYSNAARTQLLNLKTGEWDEEMLALFHIPRAALPEIKPSSGLFGYTRGLKTIPDGIPVMAMVGDSHAALFGHALGEAGCVKATYGTGSSVMAPVNSAQCDIATLATTIAWHDGENIIYGLEGNIPHTGDAVAWMADSTGLSELTDAELALELAHPMTGNMFEMDAIGATVLGGTALAGGRGRVSGSIIGAFVIVFLADGMVMMGVSDFWQMVIKGLVIVTAVVVDQFQQKLQNKVILMRRHEEKMAAAPAVKPLSS